VVQAFEDEEEKGKRKGKKDTNSARLGKKRKK